MSEKIPGKNYNKFDLSKFVSQGPQSNCYVDSLTNYSITPEIDLQQITTVGTQKATCKQTIMNASQIASMNFKMQTSLNN